MITTDQERADVTLRWVLGEKQRVYVVTDTQL